MTQIGGDYPGSFLPFATQFPSPYTLSPSLDSIQMQYVLGVNAVYTFRGHSSTSTTEIGPIHEYLHVHALLSVSQLLIAGASILGAVGGVASPQILGMW